MKIRVKLFAAAGEAAGADTVSLELAEDCTINDLRAALVEQIPHLGQLQDHLLIAVNHQYASGNAKLKPDDEVACIPPVSGG